MYSPPRYLLAEAVLLLTPIVLFCFWSLFYLVPIFFIFLVSRSNDDGWVGMREQIVSCAAIIGGIGAVFLLILAVVRTTSSRLFPRVIILTAGVGGALSIAYISKYFGWRTMLFISLPAHILGIHLWRIQTQMLLNPPQEPRSH